MLTEKDYCDYETCVALRELGYKGTSRFFYATKESTLRRYSHNQILTTRIADSVGHTLAISLYVAQKWLREEHDICVHICRPHMTNGSYVWSNTVFLHGCEVSSRGFFLSYEEALSEGIKEAVKILKDM